MAELGQAGFEVFGAGSGLIRGAAGGVEGAAGLPDRADLPERPERITKLAVDRQAVERHILAASRAAREGAAA